MSVRVSFNLSATCKTSDQVGFIQQTKAELLISGASSVDSPSKVFDIYIYYIYIYYIYICMYVCMYYIYMYVLYIYICMYYICIYVCIIYICMYYIYMYYIYDIYVHNCVYIYICINAWAMALPCLHVLPAQLSSCLYRPSIDNSAFLCPTWRCGMTGIPFGHKGFK